MGAEENKQRTIRAIEIFNSGDAAAYLGNYAEDASVHGLPPEYEPTRDGLRAFIDASLNALPDLRFVPEDVFGEGDLVLVRGRFRPTHQGKLMGAALTGRHVGWELATMLLRFAEDGRIAEFWIESDTLALLSELDLHAGSKGASSDEDRVATRSAGDTTAC